MDDLHQNYNGVFDGSSGFGKSPALGQKNKNKTIKNNQKQKQNKNKTK